MSKTSTPEHITIQDVAAQGIAAPELNFDKWADYFHAAAGKRLEILRAINDNPDTDLGTLAEIMGVTSSSLSQNLSILRHQKIILTRAEGQRRFLSINPTHPFKDMIDSVLGMIKENNADSKREPE